RRGDPITVAVIGGSITQGASATAPEKRYGDRVAAWWRERFPKSTVTFVNAGIGATGSDYGAQRAERDLLCHHPDFVVVEYAVNDPNGRAPAETYEGLLRQILKQPRKPAVVLLFMMNDAGGNAQEWQSNVGRHYAAPMVSYRDALWPEIKAGSREKGDVFADEVHPNDRGHEYAARFTTSLLDDVLAHLPADAELPRVQPVPAPLLTDLFETATLWEPESLRPIRRDGWKLDVNEHCWKTDKPGSVLELSVEGKLICIQSLRLHAGMGRVRAQVDKRKPVLLEGWFDQTWGGWRRTDVLARGLPPGKHTVRLILLEEKHPESTGHEFKVYEIGAAGLGGRRPRKATAPPKK
ncbi:MAG TPA: SGNH/GDSL hydrolase family protein, partial [Armatimonadota bacterium]